MLGLKPNKVQAVSTVSLAGLPTDTLIRDRQGSARRHSKGSLSGSLHGFEQLEVFKCFTFCFFVSCKGIS